MGKGEPWGTKSEILRWCRTTNKKEWYDALAVRCLKISRFSFTLSRARALGWHTDWNTHINGIIFLGVEVDRRLQLNVQRLLVGARQSHASLRNHIVEIPVVDRVTTTSYQQHQQWPQKFHSPLLIKSFSFTNLSLSLTFQIQFILKSP